MCKDIKDLDTAKKNLTFSINSLKKFIMMYSAVEKLKDSIEKKKFKQSEGIYINWRRKFAAGLWWAFALL